MSLSHSHPFTVIPAEAKRRAGSQSHAPARGHGSRLSAFGSGRDDIRWEANGYAPAREQKLLAAPLAGVAQDGTFEGYASLFGVADLGKDVVAPGAFAASLAARGAAGIRMLWQHDPAEPIGRWLSLAEDARGLRVRGALNLAVARAREIHALMLDGAVDGLSIGFRVERARTDRAGLRRIERLDLWEISVVTFPMLPGARVAAVKGVALSDIIRRAARRLFAG
jgi:hypothetical protein